MSRAIASIEFVDGVQLYGIYDGTVDRLLRGVFQSRETAWKNREMLSQNPLLPTDCTCSGDEDVVVFHEYGNGELFLSKACRFCCVITGNTNPHSMSREA